MNGDFDPSGHKNLELFRYYLDRELAKIDQNIQDKSNELLGYFVASLVDMSVVVLFNDIMVPRKWTTSSKLIVNMVR